MQVNSSWLSRRRNRITCIAWTLFYLAAATASLLEMRRGDRPVNDIYELGAERWLAGKPLYDGAGGGFIYLPQSAIAYAPFAQLPDAAQNIVWRLVSVGIFAAGVYSICRLSASGSGLEFFPCATLLILPKTWTCAVNGQATLAMSGLLMLALAEIDRNRWWRAITLMLVAMAVKPLALILVLLTAALYRPMRARFAVAIPLFFAIPFLTQRPEYVAAQYAASPEMLMAAARVGLKSDWTQVFALGQLMGIEIGEGMQTGLRLAAAIATLALAIWSGRRFSPAFAVVLVYALSVNYLLLFNPRTENNSYVMLSPILACLCLRADFMEHRITEARLLCASAVLLAAGHELCSFLTPRAGIVWICPLVALLSELYLIVILVRAERARGGAVT